MAALIRETGLNTSVDTLIGQIASAAGGAQNYVYDGPSATSVPLSPDKFPGAADATQKTVADSFANNPGQQALSQANGFAIWIQANDWEPWYFGIPSSFNGPYGSATLMHELLHKNMVGGGFSHDQMFRALASVGAQGRSLGRNEISQQIANLCF